MYRRALQTLFVAATLLLSTTACDKGGDTKSAAKDGGKKTDDSGKVETDKADEGGAAEAGTPPEPVKTDEGGAAAEAGAPAEEGGEVAADSGAAAAEAGEPDGAEAGEKDPPKDPPKDPVKEPKDGGEKDPPKDGGDVSAKVDAKSIFEGKCKSCHGADGKGDTTIGKKVNIPSLSGTSLSKAKIVSTIENGVPDTKMKAYKDKLSKDEINALADYVKKL